MKASTLLIGPVTFNRRMSSGLFVTDENGETHLIGILTTFRRVLKLPEIKNDDGTTWWDNAVEFQQAFGEWIAKAINEKLQREKGGEGH